MDNGLPASKGRLPSGTNIDIAHYGSVDFI